MKKISIIVPVYNTEQYLRKCLNSLVSQTLEGIEIIVVNDGTRDHSQSIIDEFVNQYPKKVIGLIKENGGLSSARNFGMKKATGEYIAFVDSDDWVLETMYEELYQKAKEHDFDVVACDFNEIRDGKTVPCFCHIEQDLFGKDVVKQHMIDFYPSAWNKIYKKVLFENLQFKEGVWFEDVELGYRLLPYIESIGVVHQHFYQYLIREGSITSTVDPRIYHCIDNWNGVLMYYKEYNLYERYQNELEYCYVRYVFASFIKMAVQYDKKEYCKAVKKAISEVNKHFPNYRKNMYLKKFTAKNMYLRHFGPKLAKLVYWYKH